MFGLPRPDPFHLPDSPEQAASDLLLHGAISLGAVGLAYAYTGAWVGPGLGSTIGMAFFSTAEVGAAGASSIAFSDTMFALSVYAEPFVAVGRFVAPVVVPLVVATVLHHSVTYASRKLGLYEADMTSSGFQSDLDQSGIGYTL